MARSVPGSDGLWDAFEAERAAAKAGRELSRLQRLEREDALAAGFEVNHKRLTAETQKPPSDRGKAGYPPALALMKC